MFKPGKHPNGKPRHVKLWTTLWGDGLKKVDFRTLKWSMLQEMHEHGRHKEFMAELNKQLRKLGDYQQAWKDAYEAVVKRHARSGMAFDWLSTTWMHCPGNSSRRSKAKPRLQ